jgi:hypothetical protein
MVISQIGGPFVFGILQKVSDGFSQKLSDSLKIGKVKAPFAQFVIGEGCLGTTQLPGKFLLAQAGLFSCLLQFSADFFISFHISAVSIK